MLTMFPRDIPGKRVEQLKVFHFFLNQLSLQLQHMGYLLGGTFCSSSKEIIKYISAFVSTFA